MAANQIKPTTNLITPDESSALREFFIDSLKDIYWIEKNLLRALPKMATNATSDELRLALQIHLVETENQVTKLEQVFASLDEKAQARKCEAMEGLIREAENIMAETEDGSMTRDVGIIAAAQKVEHYEIASYGTIRALAEVLGFHIAAELLNQILDEEKKAHSKLTLIADKFVNKIALKEG